MAEFKMMPKMSTSEGSAVLKLAKGGMAGGTTKMSTVKSTNGYQAFKSGGPVMKAGGGAMGALSDMAAMKMAGKRAAKKAPTAAMEDKYPPKPGRAMPSSKPMTPPSTFMKEGGKADMAQDKAMVKKAMKQHDAQQHESSTDLKLKKGGKAGYKDGGSIGNASKVYSSGVSGMPRGAAPKATKASLNDGEESWAKTKVNTHSRATSSTLKDYGATGQVPKTKAAGYKDGGKVKKFAFGGPSDQPSTEGKKDGGVMKKAYADGGKVFGKMKAETTMNAAKMPEGKKAPSAPVRINQLAGTFKNGGKVEY